MIQIEIVKKLPSANDIMRQINYGTAVGLTKTAKDGQDTVVKAVKATFTYRGRWLEQGNRFGIRVKPATKNDLESQVTTQADWLKLHEEGGTKNARTSHGVAIPQEKIRPRGSTKIIRGPLKPGALLAAGKGAFVIKTAHGEAIVKRMGRGKNKQLVFLYDFRPNVRVKKQSTFYEPLEKVVKRRIGQHISREIQNALKVMRF